MPDPKQSRVGRAPHAVLVPCNDSQGTVEALRRQVREAPHRSGFVRIVSLRKSLSCGLRSCSVLRGDRSGREILMTSAFQLSRMFDGMNGHVLRCAVALDAATHNAAVVRGHDEVTGGMRMTALKAPRPSRRSRCEPEPGHRRFYRRKAGRRDQAISDNLPECPSPCPNRQCRCGTSARRGESRWSNTTSGKPALGNAFNEDVFFGKLHGLRKPLGVKRLSSRIPQSRH